MRNSSEMREVGAGHAGVLSAAARGSLGKEVFASRHRFTFSRNDAFLSQLDCSRTLLGSSLTILSRLGCLDRH